MNLNIFSDLRRPGLVPGESLSPSTNINSVIEKIKVYIMSNKMRSLHMQKRDKNVNRYPILDLVNVINYVNVWVSAFGSTVICKEVCHLCGDKWSTDPDWNHTIVSRWYLEG